MTAFALFIAAWFALVVLYALGLALDVRDMRAKLVQRTATKRSYKSTFPNVESSWGLDLWARIVSWAVVILGTFAFVSLTVAIINGF